MFNEDRPDVLSHFRRGCFSLVSKSPSPAHIDEICTILPRGTKIYLSAEPNSDPNLLSAGTTRLIPKGLRPVPHVAVRMFTDEGAVDAFLRQLREAGADQVFLIAGDLARPAGVLESALQLIKSSVLVENGVHEIGIAGYPEGHPELPENELDISLAEKINAAEKLGVNVHIATQFCFHAAQIATWVQRVRGMGFRNRIRIGIAGPSRISTLLAYAANFGVPTSEKELQQGGSASEGFWTPKALLKELSDEFGKHDPGEVSLHLFAFGGLPNSARWLVNVASGA